MPKLLGIIDIFVVGGHAEYPDIYNNYGRAYTISTGSVGGPDWSMFRRDEIRSACVCDLNVKTKEEFENMS